MGKNNHLHTGSSSQDIQLQITVDAGLTADGGIDRPEQMTRLKWLNSTLAQGEYGDPCVYKSKSMTP